MTWTRFFGLSGLGSSAGGWHSSLAALGPRNLSVNSDSSSGDEAPNSKREAEQLVVQEATHSLSLVLESGKFAFLRHLKSVVCHVQGASGARLCHVCSGVALARLDNA